MKEQEYIMIRDLGIISSAKNVIRELCCDTSEIIDQSEYDEVARLLTKWERKHYSKINTKD